MRLVVASSAKLHLDFISVLEVLSLKLFLLSFLLSLWLRLSSRIIVLELKPLINQLLITRPLSVLSSAEKTDRAQSRHQNASKKSKKPTYDEELLLFLSRHFL